MSTDQDVRKAAQKYIAKEIKKTGNWDLEELLLNPKYDGMALKDILGDLVVEEDEPMIKKEVTKIDQHCVKQLIATMKQFK